MRTLERYMPENSIETISEKANAVVYTYDNAGPCAIAYSGKRKKNDKLQILSLAMHQFFNLERFAVNTP